MAKSLDIIDPKKDSQNQNEEAEMTAEDVGIETKNQGGVFYLVLGIIALVVATAAALYILYNDKGSSNNSGNSTETTATASQVTSATVSATTSLTPSPTVSAQASSAASSGQFKYTNEQIRIVNGNGVAGEAAKIKKVLEGKGYKIASVANASKSYTQSIIYYKKGQETLAQALKESISDQYTATVEEAQAATIGQYDAVIALGAK